MHYDKLLQGKRFFLDGGTRDVISLCIESVLKHYGGEKVTSPLECDILVCVAENQRIGEADTRAKPCFITTQQALRGMRSREGCSVVYVNPTEAMISFGNAVAMDVCKFGTRVNYVTVVMDDYIGMVYTVCKGVSDAVLYLVSDMSKNVTGQTIYIGTEDTPDDDITYIQRTANTPPLSVYVDGSDELIEAMRKGVDGQGTICLDDKACTALVFAARDAALGHILDMSAEDFDRLWERNYLRAFDLCHEAARRMNNEGFGSIVLIGTDNIVGGARLTSAFSASVGALKGLMRQINALYPYVRCNLLMAGAQFNALTPLYEEFYGDDAPAFIALTALLPKRDGLIDLADAALYLLSADSAPLKGQCIPVNGGIRTLAHPIMAHGLNEVRA